MPDHAIPAAGDFPLRRRLHGEAATERLAARIAGRLQGGESLLLWGPLGAGKTRLVQGLCRALGVDEEVTSPTFTLASRYAGSLVVHHLDFFRIGPRDDLDDVGVEEILAEVAAGGAILVAEWPERLADLVPERLELLVLPGEESEQERIWHLRGWPELPPAWDDLLEVQEEPC